MTIETSTSIENLAAAIGKFQAETHGVVRDATNPFHKNRYATLEAVIETARPALTASGLAFLQAPSGLASDITNSVELTTMLMHGASGEWVRFSTVMPLPKADPQGVGSAITYACRYALMAMLGLPPLDDDAEATKPQQKPQERPTGVAEAAAQAVDAAQSRSKQIYMTNAIAQINRMESASQLLEWAKKERKMVWPQYKIDPHDEDGQKLVYAYKERIAVLEHIEEDADRD
jgi:hypothetical protein